MLLQKNFSFFLLLLPLLLIACSGSKESEIKTAEDRFNYGKELFDDEKYLEAIPQFDIVRLQYQGSSVSDKAQYYTGMARFHHEDYLLAAYDFELLIRNYPSSVLVPDAYFMIAQSYVKKSPPAPLDQTYTYRALEALQTFIELYPTHARVPEAQKHQADLINRLAQKEFETGVLYEKMENPKAALISYDRVLDQYYNSDYGDDALVAKIRIVIRRKKNSEAQKLIEMFFKKFPTSPLQPEVEQMQRVLSLNGFDQTTLKSETHN